MIYGKYCANGNDFLITTAFHGADRGRLAKKVCDRYYGAGADGLIVLLPRVDYDFAWEFYNADGSHAAMCGNGARAAALYAFHNGLGGAEQRFMTGAGAVSAKIYANGVVEAQLTEYKIARENIKEYGATWQLIEVGVPHLITNGRLSIFDRFPLSDLRYKYDANISVYSVRNRAIRVRTFERGVESETLACGTGMAACYISAFNAKKIASPCIVYPRSGEKVTCSIVDSRVRIKGKVVKLFDAVFGDNI
ncbi:MAG: diaminopimelate epimerase [Helicobacteraceae bacterium]|jgi:diaminopimelate epimerase|nr:diaminopimelate epimerase [Helicobacteraceae bacterium]